VVGGDYNVKNTHRGSRLTTRKGLELYDAIEEHECECQSPRKPTYWPTDEKKVPDLLDFLITTKTSAIYIEIEEKYGLS
jgi:hypothetical protein